jgi:hypothetical protein
MTGTSPPTVLRPVWSAAVLPPVAPRPAMAHVPVVPVLRPLHGQRQLSLDLRPR